MKISIYPLWWRRHFLTVELGLAVLLGIAFQAWLRYDGGSIPTASLLDGNRAAIYGALASIFGSLLGFVIASISIVMSFSTSDKLTVLRESKQYSTLWKVFTSATKVLGVTTMLSVAGLVFDKDKHPLDLLLSLCVIGMLASVFRIARCIWVLENLIDVFIHSPRN